MQRRRATRQSITGVVIDDARKKKVICRGAHQLADPPFLKSASSPAPWRQSSSLVTSQFRSHYPPIRTSYTPSIGPFEGRRVPHCNTDIHIISIPHA